jgi:KTSC domain
MDKVFLNSESLNAVAYDTDASTLVVEFNNGKAYRYFDVPKRIYDGLINTSLKEQNFNKHIKDQYPYQRLS